MRDLDISMNTTLLRGSDAMIIFQLFSFYLGFTALQALKLPPKRPNIVFMIVDDLGWNDVSFHGSRQIPTPNIDAIARDGIILNQYYVQATCSPSRGSLMTGKYPIQLGFQHEVIKANQPWGLPLEEKILPEFLKKLGYTTHAVGKWHLGFFKEEYLPMKRGFDSFFGYYNGLEDYYTHISSTGGRPKGSIIGAAKGPSCNREMEGLDLHEGYKNVWHYNGTYGTDLFTEKAKKVIEEHNPNEPLFLYFAQQAPHTGNFKNPLQAPEKYVKPMIGIEDEKRKVFAGMVSAMDASVGDIFQSLEKTGLLEDTIFIFTTDNGGAPYETDGAMGSNWPLKGSKYNLWEGGVRGVSFIWSPKLRHRSRIYNEMMHISDWLPTILYAAGGPEALKLLPTKGIFGVNQWPSLTHLLPSPRSEILLNMDDEEGVEGIRKGRYKLVKGSYYEANFDKWYDKEGRVFNVTHSIWTPQQRRIYNKNYVRFLRRSKAARILWRKYGKDPRLTVMCLTPSCKEQLEVKCKVPPPSTPTCDAKKKQACLYDIVRDPCEFYNIAEQLPEVTAELEMALAKYRTIAIPPGGPPGDPKADPKLHGNVWKPWM